MPMPQHCIDCDKVAVVLDNTTPYCTKCYGKERFKKSTYRGGPLSKRKTKSWHIWDCFFVKNESGVLVGYHLPASIPSRTFTAS